MWPFYKKKCYFAIFEVDKIDEKNSLSPEIMKYIKKYFKRRFKTIKYFEPFSGEKTSIVIGSEEVGKRTNRNVLIFLLELYASLKNPSLSVTDDFKKKIKLINNQTITIYSFKKK